MKKIAIKQNLISSLKWDYVIIEITNIEIECLMSVTNKVFRCDVFL